MNGRIFLLLTGLATGLSACGPTAAQRQFESMQAGLVSANADLKACVAAQSARPEFAKLLPHIPPLEGRLLPTAAQLSDPDYPTPEEARSLGEFTTHIASCENAYRARFASLEPAAGPALDRLTTDLDEVFATLIERNVSWAAGAKQINEVYERDLPALQAAYQDTMIRLESAHQQELAARQQAAAVAATALEGIAAAAGAAAAGYANAHSPPTVVYAPVVVCRGFNC